MVVFGSGTVRVFADTILCPTGMSQLDCSAIFGGWEDWVPTSNACGSTTLTSGTADTELSLTSNQVAVAQTIIGIAKTDGLGERGALIGIMVAIDETGLKNEANNGNYVATQKDNTNYGYEIGSKPYAVLGSVSEALPHDDDGHDHDSVGVFQQRAIDGRWAPMPLAADHSNLSEVVKWLMTPAYAAEVFYGGPADSPAPFNKGLQRITDWQTMDPWVAAQKVQGSATPDGSNYKRYVDDAQQIVNKYYGPAPAVPLPAPFSGSDTGSGSDNIAICGMGNIVQTALTLAWPEPGHSECKSDATQPYQQALPIAQGHPDLNGNDACGPYDDIWSDCGVFVATTIRTSGADPDYPTRTTNVQSGILDNKPQWQVVGQLTDSTAQLHPGDVLIRTYYTDDNNDGVIEDNERHGHTWIYLGDLTKYGITSGYDMADASWHTHVPEIHKVGPAWLHTDHTFTIYRLISPEA